MPGDDRTGPDPSKRLQEACAYAVAEHPQSPINRHKSRETAGQSQETRACNCRDRGRDTPSDLHWFTKEECTVSVPIKAAAATASLTLALMAASATAFTDTQFQAQAHTPTTAQQADRILRGLPGLQRPQGPQILQQGRALRLALVQKE